MITILCGKSASGKDTALKILRDHHDFLPVVSTTSRPMRDGEIPGVDYVFVSKSDFVKGIANEAFAEHRSYRTLVNGEPDVWYYGTPKKQLATLDPDLNYAMIIDLEGAKGRKNAAGKENCRVYYLDAPDELRTSRARARGSFDETEWNRRLADDNARFTSDLIAETVDGVVLVKEHDSPEAIAAMITTMLAASFERFEEEDVERN